MSASEIKGNEVEGGKQPEREPRTPSEQDKSKLQPNENTEQKTEAPKDGGSSNRRNNSEHPKLDPSDSSQNSDHNPEPVEKRNEHPKLNEPSENNTTKRTSEAEKKSPSESPEKDKEASLSETGKEGAECKGEGTKPQESTESGNDTSDKNYNPSETEVPDYKNRVDRTPKNHGEWVNEDGTPGQRGESKFVPDDPGVQKTLQDNGVDGIKYNDCYPDMSPVSKFDAYLEPDDYLKSDKDQFQMCNDSLADAVVPDPDTGEVENPELAAQFTPDQLADIEAGDTPDGYTWHHDVDSGHMQLVPTDVHQACRHSGGRSLWGGGADYR